MKHIVAVLVIAVTMASSSGSADEDRCEYVGENGSVAWICERNYGGEDCSPDGRHVTEASIPEAALRIRGERGCWTEAGTNSYSALTVYGPAFTLVWGESTRPGNYQCNIFVWPPGVVAPCAAPPPDPGWGSLLP